MPYRTFADSTRTEWQVWDIVPQLTERRNGEHTERRAHVEIIPFADRRREARRIAESRRAILRGTYAQGWLCFESDAEKRRLSPIPSDWTTCRDEKLEAYVRRAERASGNVRLAAGFNGSEPLAEAG